MQAQRNDDKKKRKNLSNKRLLQDDDSDETEIIPPKICKTNKEREQNLSNKTNKRLLDDSDDEDVKVVATYSDNYIKHRETERRRLTEGYNVIIREIRNGSQNINIQRNILGQISFLTDDSVQCYLMLLKEKYPSVNIYPVYWIMSPDIVEPCKTQTELHIMGGTRKNQHWVCTYYNGSQLFIYDSWLRARFNRKKAGEKILVEDEEKFIAARYPNINLNQVILREVTQRWSNYFRGCNTTTRWF